MVNKDWCVRAMALKRGPTIKNKKINVALLGSGVNAQHSNIFRVTERSQCEIIYRTYTVENN